MTEGHAQCGVGALLRVEPEVGELGHLGVVRGDGDGLGALVADLGEEVRVRGTGLRDVGAPGDDVAGVVPVGRFRHVGLLAPDLRAGRRQVAVPVVEGQAHAADQRQVTGAGGVADHGHGRDRREADHPVRAVGLGGVDVGGGDDVGHFVPAGTNEATQAALALVAVRLGLVLDDARPGIDRVLVHRAGFTPQLEQRLAHLRVLQAVGAVDVPGVTGATRAAARFVVGQVGAGTRIVGLLGFPGDQAVLHVDLPRAGTCAVHPVGGPHDLVVLPTLAISAFPGAALVRDLTMAVGEFALLLLEELQAVEQVTHLYLLTRSTPGVQNESGSIGIGQQGLSAPLRAYHHQVATMQVR
ncbi:hypothetical protein D9M71_332620 [compost metagenome]